MAVVKKTPKVVKKEVDVRVTPPNFQTIEVLAEGTAPLVIERFSVKQEMMEKMAEGQTAKNKKVLPPRDFEAEAQRAKHISEEGWEGFSAPAIRAACISACRLCGYKMTLAKLSIFVDHDGFDVEDGDPIVRIYGEAKMFTKRTRNADGSPGIRARPMYRRWGVRIRIKFDADQFSMTDMFNLISRVGEQVGIGAGRPDSKMSAGQGWGTFRLIKKEEVEEFIARHGIE